MEQFTIWHWLIVLFVLGYFIFTLFRSRSKKSNINSQPAKEKSADHGSDKNDWPWPLTLTNWFLISVTWLAIDSFNGGYSPLTLSNPVSTWLGLNIAIFGISAIISAVLYVVNPQRAEFRVRRCITITAWCLISISLYSLIRPPH